MSDDIEKAVVSLEIETPRMPNYLKLCGLTSETNQLDIADLSDIELEKFAEMWKQALIKHAKDRRKP